MARVKVFPGMTIENLQESLRNDLSNDILKLETEILKYRDWRDDPNSPAALKAVAEAVIEQINDCIVAMNKAKEHNLIYDQNLIDDKQTWG